MATRLTYREQLLHPNWQRKRLEVLQKSSFCCEMCGDADSTLHVHHKRYVKGREVWEYQDDELQVLCESCHAQHHETHKLLEEVLAKVDPLGSPYAKALALTAGFFFAADAYDPELAESVRKFVGSAAFDLGVAAYALGVSSRSDAAAALATIKLNEVNNAAISSLLERWSAPPPNPIPNPFDEGDVE